MLKLLLELPRLAIEHEARINPTSSTSHKISKARITINEEIRCITVTLSETIKANTSAIHDRKIIQSCFSNLPVGYDTLITESIALLSNTLTSAEDEINIINNIIINIKS